MNNLPMEDDDVPAEIDFSKGERSPHHIPSGATILTPGSERQSDTPEARSDKIKLDTDRPQGP